MNNILPVYAIPKDKRKSETLCGTSREIEEKEDKGFHDLYAQMLKNDAALAYDGVNVAELAEKGKVFG